VVKEDEEEQTVLNIYKQRDTSSHNSIPVQVSDAPPLIAGTSSGRASLSESICWMTAMHPSSKMHHHRRLAPPQNLRQILLQSDCTPNVYTMFSTIFSHGCKPIETKDEE